MTDLEICRENIRRHTSLSPDISDAMEYHLLTAAKTVCRGTKNVGNTDSDFASVRRNMRILSEDGAEIPVGIYRFIADILFDGGMYSLAEKLFPETLPDEPTAVYLKNAAADEAYSRFSGMMPGLRFAYADGFADGCEAVYDGRYDAVILPCGESGPAMSGRTAALVDTYGLKKIAGCTVGRPDGEDVFFSLFSSRIYPDKSRLDAVTELSVSFGKNEKSAALLRRMCGLAELLDIVISDTGVTGRQRERFRFVFDCSASAIPPLVCFLAAEAEHFEIDGLAAV